MNLTYKELQAELKTARSNGLPLNVKLNAKHSELLAEYERIQTGSLENVSNEVEYTSSMRSSSPALIVYKPFAQVDEAELVTVEETPLEEVELPAGKPELQEVEDSVPFKRMRSLVKDAWLPSFMKKPLKEYRSGADTFFDYEYQGQYSELTCEVLYGQYTELTCLIPEGYYLRGQSSELPVPKPCLVSPAQEVPPATVPVYSQAAVYDLDPTCRQALENGKHFLRCVKAFCIGFNEGLKSKRRH